MAFIAQNNVVRLGSGALGPRNYVFHRALRWFQFPQGGKISAG